MFKIYLQTVQLWLKMTAEISKFADFTYLRNANQRPAVYPEVTVNSMLDRELL